MLICFNQTWRCPASDRVATLKNILFAYEPLTESLVVGPVKLNQKTLLGPDLGDTTVPQLHEFGATVTIRKTPRGRWRKAVRVRAKYPPRPFMGPALEAEQDHIPGAWSPSVS